MPGRNNSTNKYGWTAFTVGPVLGDGCNYNTVQSAIDDCFAAGGGVVLIRAGTYVENLILRAGVDLIGADVDGRLPSTFSHVVLQGNHSFTGTAGVFICICENITFSALAGDAFTLTATVGGNLIFALKFCGLEAFTDPTSRAFVLDADGTSACQVSTDNSNFSSSSSVFEAIGAGSAAAFLSLGSANSVSDDIFRLSVGSGSLAVEYMNVSSTGYVFNGITANGNVTFSYSDVFAGLEAVIFPAAAGQCIASHSTISSGAVSGFWIDGTGGQVDFVDIALTGSAIDIGPLITQQKLNWQPYGETAAAAVGSLRGTASFDSAQFTVTDGWVQLAVAPTANSFPTDSGTATPAAGVINVLGGPGVTTSAAGNTITINSVTYTEQVANFQANVDEGYWVSNGVTVSLPLSGSAVDGDTVEIVCVATPVVVAADVGERIFIGNQQTLGGGSITNNADGDAIVFRYRASGPDWYAISVIGNWTI